MRIERSLGELAAAHRLMNYNGSCELLHGHNWAIDVWLDSDVDPTSGISIDFLALEDFWKQLRDQFDHGIWLNRADPLIQVLENNDVHMKLTRVDGEPTAENVAALISNLLAEAFPEANACGVRVGEMRGCSAETSLVLNATES